jgi:NADH-quinone oxidoreductase subunit M
MDASLVILLIALPLVGGVAVWALPQRRESLAGPLALLIGLVTAVFSFVLWFGVSGVGPNGLVGEFRRDWIVAGERLSTGELASGILIKFHVGVDAISAPLVVLTGMLVPLSIACSFAAIRTRVREYYAWMLLLTAAMFGVFVARDVLLFYVFFEFTLLPLYFLIGIWGSSERRRAANMFFLYTFAGSVITFAGILYIALRAAGGSGLIDFDLLHLSRTAQWPAPLTSTEQWWLFLAFFCGFAIKVPFFPLHTWLPLAHTEAPTAGSVLLAGVLLKLGTYGFLRFSLPMLPDGTVQWAQFVGVLAVAGIIYGALCSWVQRDVKKLVAYSSVSHLGFCMLGMFSFLPVGLSGSVLYMVNHGLSTGALFLIVGMLYERYHTRDIDAIGGLARQMPILAFFLVFFVLSSVGLPGLNGFVSEFTTLLAAYNSPQLGVSYGVWGATGILLGAIYLLYMAGKVLFGPVKEPAHTPDTSHGLTRDLTSREVLILTPLAAACVVLGVAPRVVTDSLDGALASQVLGKVRPYLAQESEPHRHGDTETTRINDGVPGGAGQRGACVPRANRGAPSMLHTERSRFLSMSLCLCGEFPAVFGEEAAR